MVPIYLWYYPRRCHIKTMLSNDPNHCNSFVLSHHLLICIQLNLKTKFLDAPTAAGPISGRVSGCYTYVWISRMAPLI